MFSLPTDVPHVGHAERSLANNYQLGTFGRAKRKVEEMSNVIAESRRTGHH
jgi:hypothetical protein